MYKNIKTGYFVLLAALMMPRAQAVDITVNYIGEVISSTCSLEGNNVTFNLNKVSVDDLLAHAVSFPVNWKAQGIALVGCPSQFKIKFEYTPDKDAPNLIAMSAQTNSAINVGVRPSIVGAPGVGDLIITSSGQITPWIANTTSDKIVRFSLGAGIARTSNTKAPMGGKVTAQMSMTFIYQ